MPDQSLDYGRLVERALRSVVRDALEVVAKRGMPGRHHLYITFRTDHPAVAIDDGLRARYPAEMTIVLQHEFWGLEVGADRFAVGLSFGDVPAPSGDSVRSRDRVRRPERRVRAAVRGVPQRRPEPSRSRPLP